MSIRASRIPEWPATAHGAGQGKENEGDREHFWGGPVSKTIEGAEYPVSNQCSASRALRGSIGFPAAGLGCREGVVTTHGRAFSPARIWQMSGVHGLL